ncbi:MAG TPA: hypothetical protein VK476_01140, partial [Flavobacterium sp.]|nr:hypothetical protein [Flavobacterium sp.]
ERYNVGGQLIFEKRTGYQRELLFPGDYLELTYQYSDTLLMKMTTVIPGGDSIRREYEYDTSGRCVREITFRRRDVPKDTVLPVGFAINVVSTDTNDGKWIRRNEWNHSYDRWGRKIASEIVYAGSADRDNYKWEYDEQGRITKFEYNTRGNPRFKEVCEYFAGGYRFTRTWYDEKGKVVRKVGRRTPHYMREVFDTYRIDEQGRVIEKRAEDRKGKLIARTVKSYNAQGKIARVVHYDASDAQAITHIYTYK